VTRGGGCGFKIRQGTERDSRYPRLRTLIAGQAKPATTLDKLLLIVPRPEVALLSAGLRNDDGILFRDNNHRKRSWSHCFGTIRSHPSIPTCCRSCQG
jgi:hypothetical protein